MGWGLFGKIGHAFSSAASSVVHTVEMPIGAVVGATHDVFNTVNSVAMIPMHLAEDVLPDSIGGPLRNMEKLHDVMVNKAFEIAAKPISSGVQLVTQPRKFISSVSDPIKNQLYVTERSVVAIPHNAMNEVKGAAKAVIHEAGTIAHDAFNTVLDGMAAAEKKLLPDFSEMLPYLAGGLVLLVILNKKL